MPTTQLRLLLVVLSSTLVAAAPAAAQLTVDFGTPPVTIVDGGAGDVCASTDEVCIAGALVFTGYTIQGPCTTTVDVAAGLGGRMWVSDCSVIKDASAGPTSVPINFTSAVFAALPATTNEMVLDAVFTDVAPLFNLSVQLDASTNLGFTGTAGPLVPPAAFAIAGPTAFGPGVNQLFGTATFNLDNVGDRINLPSSAQIIVSAPPPVPTSSEFGYLVLGALLIGSTFVLIQLRTRTA